MMPHQTRQPMPPTAARVMVLEAEIEALRRRVAQLEAALARAETPASTEVRRG